MPSDASIDTCRGHVGRCTRRCIPRPARRCARRCGSHRHAYPPIRPAAHRWIYIHRHIDGYISIDTSMDRHIDGYISIDTSLDIYPSTHRWIDTSMAIYPSTHRWIYIHRHIDGYIHRHIAGCIQQYMHRAICIRLSIDAALDVLSDPGGPVDGGGGSKAPLPIPPTRMLVSARPRSRDPWRWRPC